MSADGSTAAAADGGGIVKTGESACGYSLISLDLHLGADGNEAHNSVVPFFGASRAASPLQVTECSICDGIKECFNKMLN